MSETRGKLVCKSDYITETPMRGMAAKFTPNAKKISEREQDSAKKTRHMKKKGLLKFFREGPRVPAPSAEGTPIKAVKKRRDNKADGSLDWR
jgi:hypothetical protein